jgi:nucleotide-binding universal stress UspA family protein
MGGGTVSTILAAIEPSAAAGPVLDVATALAERLGLTPVAVHVPEGDAEPARLLAEHWGMRLLLAEGTPADAIRTAMEREGAELAVVGARRLPTGPRPAGETALAVAAGASRPVVVVPPNPHLDPSTDPKLLVLPLEDAEELSAAAREALLRLGGAGIRLRVVHVFDEANAPRFWDRPEHDAQAWAHEFLARWDPAPEVELELRAGLPVEGILDVATEHGADLIALSWSRELAEHRDQVAREILARALVPVVLLPCASPWQPERARRAGAVVPAT